MLKQMCSSSRDKISRGEISWTQTTQNDRPCGTLGLRKWLFAIENLDVRGTEEEVKSFSEIHNFRKRKIHFS